MVSIYQGGGKKRAPGNRSATPQAAVNTTVTIEHWDPRGRGVCRSHKPVLFVDGALPGELCDVAVTSQKKQVWEGKVKKILSPSEKRQTPFCAVYEQCGGCQLQHTDTHSALLWRQQALDSQLCRQHQLDTLPWVAPVYSPVPEYRRKTRLAIDARKGKPMVLGYRGQQSGKVINVTQCPILMPALNALLPVLHEVIGQLNGRGQLGHISLLQADNATAVTLRCTKALGEADRQLLKTAATAHDFHLSLDFGEHQEVLHQQVDALYCDTALALELAVTTEDFIQVNRAVNLAMIEQALDWLAPQPSEQVLDLFCGLGNFSLPLAKRCAGVTAVEGVATMVQRGEQIARKQGINTINWRTADLSNAAELGKLAIKKFDKILLDPSREGAFEACEFIAKGGNAKVVYVSCNPATFNRDLTPLLNAGYRISKIGLMEMFPYTQHIEIMALLERPTRAKGER